MPVLSAQQRKLLEDTVTKARKISETGAQNALAALAVDQPEPFAHMGPEQRALRNRLRNKGRLLGDDMTANGSQTAMHLAYELAYEYWHKMLFARFLEANNLLMHPSGVPVTLEECEELAGEEDHADKWTAAASYASGMLPAIFRPEDPVMQIEFTTEDRIKLETLLDNVEPIIFTADDSLGWVYQFWQSEEKARVNKSGDKINGEKLPAVTQLFTEPYMVHFLIDNTIGAWWVARNPDETPPIEFEYLRRLPTPSGEGQGGEIAAGTFNGWPDTTREITMLDPCMGSGHFIVELFKVLVTLRMYEENLTPKEATDRVIAENLNGLEIDTRCTQIAAFNLALTAWKFCGHYKELPEMNLACSGIAPKGKREDWVKLIGRIPDTVFKARMENGMRVLYDHFQLAPELGSLLDPSALKPDVFTASFDELLPVLFKALEGESNKDKIERGVMAAGIAKAGNILAKKYTLQITNVPYLSRGKQDEKLTKYFKKNYPEAKGDLATVFFDKMIKTTQHGGVSCSVILQNWLFLTTYKKLREKLLKKYTWSIVARLGTKGFQTPMWDFNVMLISIQNQKPTPFHLLTGLDVSEAPNVAAKAKALKTADLKTVNQAEQLGNPDAIVSIEVLKTESLLGKYSKGLAGIDTGDGNRFKFFFWELPIITSDWIVQLNSFVETIEFAGREHILFWQDGKGELLKVPGASIRNVKYWGKKGIYVVRMAQTPATLSFGEAWDRNGAMIIPEKEELLLPIWEYAKTEAFRKNLRKLNQKLSISEATFPRIHFDLNYWQKIATEKYPNGLPQPYSDDATQWLFHGHPEKTENPLQVAFARLLGYRWPAESNIEMELADEARQVITQIQAFNHLSDEDGILCIPSVNGEAAAAQVLRSYLQKVWGSKWQNHTIEELLKKEGSRKPNLEDWLRNEFFEQHFKLFHNRPFIWQIWDGRSDGFSALVNYHKLTNDKLQRLIYTYLGDWIRQCELKKKSGESGAEGLLSTALRLKEKLEFILEGEAPYDIFVRWKPLELQPIGWNPDFNDGVRLNIRPFIIADVLRKKPNIKWSIDRGKNPKGSPWGEVRDNNIHLSLDKKRTARQKY